MKSSTKNIVYEFSHKLPNDLRLRILEIMEKRKLENYGKNSKTGGGSA